MNFDLQFILMLATIFTGLVVALDKFYLQKQQTENNIYQKLIPAIKEVKSWFNVLLIIFIIRGFIIEPFRIPSGSMVPNLDLGDHIVVNKAIYGLKLPGIDSTIIPISHPKRGDVVVFKYPVDPSIFYIKRVMGLPGDKITFHSDKSFSVNGKKLALTKEETYVFENKLGILYKENNGEKEYLTRQLPMKKYAISDVSWQVPPGYYFMIGDNRDESADSRFWYDQKVSSDLQGMVPEKYIVGKAFAIWLNWKSSIFENAPTFSRNGFIN